MFSNRMVGTARRGRVVAGLSLMVAATIALAGCAGSAVSGGSKPSASKGAAVKIGVITSQTGGFSFAGPAVQQGVRVAEAAIKKGDLAGRPMSFEFADDGTATDTAFQVCTRFATTDQVDAVISSESAAESASCNQALASHNIPFIQTSQVAGNFCAPNMFTTGPVNSQLVLPLTNYLLAQGKKRFYLIGSDTAAPHAGFKDATTAIQAKGAEVVGTDFVPPNTTDYSGYISRIAAANPDVILDGITDAGLTQFLKLDTTDPRTASITKAGLIANADTIAAVGPSVAGYLVQGSFFPALGTKGGKDYIAALKKQFGANYNTNQWGAFAYTGTLALAEAYKNAGSSDPAKVLAEFKKGVTVDSPEGTVHVGGEYGNFTYQPNLIGKATAQGTVTVVTSKSLAPTGACTVQ